MLLDCFREYVRLSLQAAKVPAYSYQSFDLLFSKSEETGGRKNGEAGNCGGGDKEKRGRGSRMVDEGEMKRGKKFNVK